MNPPEMVTKPSLQDPSLDPTEALAKASCGCAGGAAGFVYAIGRVSPRLRSPGVEREFAQAAARTETKGLTDQEVLRAVLTNPENRYLARQVCWLFSIQGHPAYVLQPQEPADLDALLASLRERPKANDLDVVIGVRGPKAPPGFCGGLELTLVSISQFYSFDTSSLIKTLPRPDKGKGDDIGACAEEVFLRIQQMTGNLGQADGQRAINFLAIRYAGLYIAVADAQRRNSSLSSIEFHPSAFSAQRKLIEILLTFTDRATAVTQRMSARVDVTEEFPFLDSPLGFTGNVPYGNTKI